jgi:hypothetical protein
MVEVKREALNRNHAGRVGVAAARKYKMVEPDREHLNQLFHTLERWNKVLTTTPSLNL